MATILDDEDTIEAQALSTSFDPYGQLVKMLMPRALCIAIYDRDATPLWLSDGCDGPDLMQLVEESLTAAREGNEDPDDRDGTARTWDGETAYIFVLRDGSALLGALAVSCQDGGNSRPFSLVQGLLRPVLQVLSRELVNQYSLGDLRKDLSLRDGDLELVMEASGAGEEADSDDLDPLVRHCVTHMNCAMGALTIPDKKISITHSTNAATGRSDAEALDKTQRHLFAWAQVQRRTLMLNKAPANSPLGALPYKILACPIRQSAQNVVGVLVLLRHAEDEDFDTRQVRIAELMARRVAHVVQNAYDAVTGLLTRRAFEQRALVTLGSAIARTEHCVAYGDVDRLVTVNENHGMHVGDHVIRRIAEVIRSSVPAGVSAAAVAGDRFALFFADHSLDTAQPLLEHVCRAVGSSDFSHEGRRIPLSISFGLAAVPDTRLPLSHALAAAEVACKTAKDRGRGRVELYEEGDRSILLEADRSTVLEPERTPAPEADRSPARRHEDVAMAGNVREAIANDRFRMEAQPIMPMQGSGPARRFELLLRMVDPSGESVTPDKFLTAAERYQLATDIDRWVVQYALEILSSAAPALDNLGAHFCINISGQSLGDEHFPQFLENKLREYELPPALLSFEIAETAAVANIVRAEILIRRLQGLGHAIALDDFGRGLSSLTYLKSLSVSDLKIDGGLVRDLARNSRSQATVTAIVQLAQSMRLKTTAKCVESEAILAAIGQLGVTYGQGFAIGRPRALEVVLQELLRGAPGIVRNSASPRMARLVS